MSTEVFNDSFAVARPYMEDFEHPVVVSQAGGGRKVRRQLLTDSGLFRVYQAVIKFPRNSLATWAAFWAARKGGYDSFLYLPVLGIHRTVTDEALGTASGGGGETFALDCRYIKSSTLVVKVGGVTQTLTTDYSLSGNNTAPLITTTASFDTGTVTATYDRYIPCVFDKPSPRMNIVSLATTDAASIVHMNGLTWSQDRSGSHLV